MTRPSLSELTFPILAIAYTVYVLSEQLFGGYRASTVTYALVIGIPILLLAGAIIVSLYFKAERPEISEVRSTVATDATEPAAAVATKPAVPAASRGWLSKGRMPLFLALTAAAIFSLPWIGYLIGFTAYLVLAMLLLGMRRPLVLVSVAASLVAIIHFVFVVWLGMDLPAGLTGGLL
jgi:Tripartite tricarboxylate transporter TctB family